LGKCPVCSSDVRIDALVEPPLGYTNMICRSCNEVYGKRLFLDNLNDLTKKPINLATLAESKELDNLIQEIKALVKPTLWSRIKAFFKKG